MPPAPDSACEPMTDVTWWHFMHNLDQLDRCLKFAGFFFLFVFKEFFSSANFSSTFLSVVCKSRPPCSCSFQVPDTQLGVPPHTLTVTTPLLQEPTCLVSNGHLATCPFYLHSAFALTFSINIDNKVNQSNPDWSGINRAQLVTAWHCSLCSCPQSFGLRREECQSFCSGYAKNSKPCN